MNKFINGRGLMSALFLLGLFIYSGAVETHAVTLYGVTPTNQLVRFDSATPGTVTTVATISGLQPGEAILGIDFRPATGQLYALGSTSRIYRINKANGSAFAVGAPFTPALSGTNFGFDFNPTVDRIRIVSDTGQNLRANPNDGTVILDGALNPGTPSVTAAAYTNSVPGATTTMLFVIDSNTDQLFQQNPANAGTLIPIGAIGVDTTGVNGFDHLASGNTAFAALTVAGGSRLYTINLTSGAATLAGQIGTGALVLRGLAAELNTLGGNRAPLDFDGDGITCYTVFRPDQNQWIIRGSANGMLRFVNFGQISTDRFTPGDYDGDGRTDIAVWRETTGTFFVLRSSDNSVVSFNFGQPGDEPVARDYDGDGRTDYAVVRRTGGQLIWYINNSSNNSFRAEQFGLATDVVAPGDYDGDGRFDLAVYRGNGNQQAVFYVKGSTSGFMAVPFGLGGDLVVPGDYDGDGKTDFAVVRVGTFYNWYILRSSNNSLLSLQFGTKPDLPTQGDYDGDGKTDISVYRQETGVFYYFSSGNNTAVTFDFGVNGDYPVANYDTH